MMQIAHHPRGGGRNTIAQIHTDAKMLLFGGETNPDGYI